MTRVEDYLGMLQDGWLVFESAREKRRLEAPYPAEWRSYDIPALEVLCRRARQVLTRRAKTPSGEHAAIRASEIEREVEATTDSRRSFTSPQGREWTVRVHECLDREGATQRVLRFTAGDIVVESLTWPEHWRDLSVLEYAVLLLDAEPPRRRPKGQGPQRRLDDRVIDKVG
ncbi:MAG: hypothetical protein ABIY52_02545 [Gemmatimonadaceae bacterium]